MPASPALRAARSHSHKTVSPVAWQLSPGSESAALRSLLSAGAVNLTKAGRRQTCKTSDPESSDISRDWIPGIKDDKEIKKLYCRGSLGFGFTVFLSDASESLTNRIMRIVFILTAVCYTYTVSVYSTTHLGLPARRDKIDCLPVCLLKTYRH